MISLHDKSIAFICSAALVPQLGSATRSQSPESWLEKEYLVLRADDLLATRQRLGECPGMGPAWLASQKDINPGRETRREEKRRFGTFMYSAGCRTRAESKYHDKFSRL